MVKGSSVTLSHWYKTLQAYCGIVGTFVVLMLGACGSQRLPGALLTEANQLYEEGNYADAVVAYEALVAIGVNDQVLYYNLGNAHLRMDQLGEAIANYRRAQRLAPRDQDIAINLAVARSQTQDLVAAPTQLENTNARFLVAQLLLPTRWVSANESAYLALSLWSVLSLLVVSTRIFPAVRRRLTYGMAVGAVLLGLSLVPLGMHLSGQWRPSAVVITPDVAIKSGPGVNYLTEFTLHDGTEVQIIETRMDWVRIVLPGDLQGWAPQIAFTVVN